MHLLSWQLWRYASESVGNEMCHLSVTLSKTKAKDGKAHSSALPDPMCSHLNSIERHSIFAMDPCIIQGRRALESLKHMHAQSPDAGWGHNPGDHATAMPVNLGHRRAKALHKGKHGLAQTHPCLHSRSKQRAIFPSWAQRQRENEGGLTADPSTTDWLKCFTYERRAVDPP